MLNLKKYFITAAILMATAGCACTPKMAPADITPEITEPDPVIIVRLELKPTPQPSYRQPIMPQTREYDWAEEDLRQLASVFWAETGANSATTNREKMAIARLVWNRAHYGAPFPSTIAEVCKQRGEFNRGHISDRNVQYAEFCLNKIRTQDEEGEYQGIQVPRSALYMARDGEGGPLVLYDSSWVIVWRSDVNE